MFLRRAMFSGILHKFGASKWFVLDNLLERWIQNSMEFHEILTFLAKFPWNAMESLMLSACCSTDSMDHRRRSIEICLVSTYVPRDKRHCDMPSETSEIVGVGDGRWEVGGGGVVVGWGWGWGWGWGGGVSVCIWTRILNGNYHRQFNPTIETYI